MTEPTCDKCLFSPKCGDRRKFDKFLFDIRVSYTDREQLPLEKDWHDLIGGDCRDYDEVKTD